MPEVPRRTPRWLQPFVRVTSGGRYIPEIDGLRTIAIGSVLLFHVAAGLQAKSAAWTMPSEGGLVATPVIFGFRGVELFFVISGFVLGVPFAAHHLLGKPAVRLRDYFLRRLTRLEPPYILVMVLSFAVLVFFRGRPARQLLPRLAAGLVYLHGFVFVDENPMDNVAWSLEVEVQFYLLAPLLARLFAIRDRRLRRAVLVCLAALSAVAVGIFIRPDTRAWFSILRFLHFFLAGFLLADVYLLEWQPKPSRSLRWDLAAVSFALIFFLACAHFGRPNRDGEPLVPLLLLAVLAPLLCAAVFRGRVLGSIFTLPVVTAFGGMCYSIYLLHRLVLGPILQRTMSLHLAQRWSIDLLVQAGIALPLMMIPVAIFFLAVERPCMQKDWPQRLVARLRAGR